MEVRIYTDGACSGNPGVGGWACEVHALIKGEWKKAVSHSGGYRMTTNNRMELKAVIEGLKSMKKDGNIVEVISDSQYVCNYHNFITPDVDVHTLLNGDLWKELKEQVERQSSVKFTWVKGHDGHPQNEACNDVAVSETKKPDLPADEAYERARAMKELHEKQRKDAAARFDKNPLRKPADVSVGTTITSMECRVVLVINGHKFLSDKAFDSDKEASVYKEKIMTVLKENGINAE